MCCALLLPNPEQLYDRRSKRRPIGYAGGHLTPRFVLPSWRASQMEYAEKGFSVGYLCSERRFSPTLV